MPTPYRWPDIQLPLDCEETSEDPALRSAAENGNVMTRAKFTRIRRTWQVSWANMRGAHYRTLRAFYEQMRGGSLSFAWTHPLENTTFEVRFVGKLSARHTVRDCHSVTLSLEEV